MPPTGLLQRSFVLATSYRRRTNGRCMIHPCRIDCIRRYRSSAVREADHSLPAPREGRRTQHRHNIRGAGCPVVGISSSRGDRQSAAIRWSETGLCSTSIEGEYSHGASDMFYRAAMRPSPWKLLSSQHSSFDNYALVSNALAWDQSPRTSKIGFWYLAQKTAATGRSLTRFAAQYATPRTQ